jgi:hypothetical protein
LTAEYALDYRFEHGKPAAKAGLRPQQRWWLVLALVIVTLTLLGSALQGVGAHRLGTFAGFFAPDCQAIGASSSRIADHCGGCWRPDQSGGHLIVPPSNVTPQPRRAIEISVFVNER